MTHELNQLAANDAPTRSNDILPALGVTLHAMERYSERISEQLVSGQELLWNRKLSRRIANGVARILKNATHWGRDDNGVVFVVRTRAVVVRDGRVVTVLRASGPLGFTRRKKRDWGLAPLGSQDPCALALGVWACAA